MRQPKDRAFYAFEAEDGQPRVCHAVVGSQPEGSVEVTEAQAKGISASVRSREVRETKAAKVSGLSREEVEQVAKEAADRAVARFAQSLAKATGGDDANQR